MVFTKVIQFLLMSVLNFMAINSVTGLIANPTKNVNCMVILLRKSQTITRQWDLLLGHPDCFSQILNQFF